MTDITQLSGDYAASWLPWIMIPMVFYILPFPVFAIVFLWIEQEGRDESTMGDALMSQNVMGSNVMDQNVITQDMEGSEMMTPEGTS